MADLKTDEALGEVVPVPLSTTSLRDLIRSNLVEPQDAIRWLRLEGHVNAHNREVDALLSARGGTVARRSLDTLVFELVNRQNVLRSDLSTLLEILRQQGYEVPA